MPFEFQTHQGLTIAVLSGTLDSTLGEEWVAQVQREIPKGGKLVVDGSDLKTLTQQGVLHLMTAQRWTSAPERKRLPLVGFSPMVWRAIVENGSDFFFDSKPTLNEALALFGASAYLAPFAPPEPDAPTAIHRAVPLSPQPESWLEPLPGIPAPEPFAAPPPPPVAAPRPTPNFPPLPAAVAAPPYATPNFPLPAAARPKSSRNPLLWLVIGIAFVVLFGAISWWLFRPRVPVLTLSTTSAVVEEDGKEADEITAQVQGGRLVEKSWSALPAGLYFEPPSDDSGTRTYTLRGKAAPGAATAAVQLEAVNDGGQHSAPVAFTVNVKEKPTTWQLNTLQSLGLKVGRRIWTQSKFLVNAERVLAKSGLPPGLKIEPVPGKSKDWQLTGTPTAAGSYAVVFAAVSPTGKQEEQSCTLEVTADADAAPPKPADSTAPAPAPPKAAVVSNVDDGMRRFLLDRIENLPSYYTDQDRENLRSVVGTLQQARLIHRVVFEREGQTELSPGQSALLKTALESTANAALIKDSACQIVVVGYASKTGSLASNVRISKLRARAVNDFLKGVVGHNADLCGDYGPTDVLDQSADETNRAVEVYAGILEPSSGMQANAERFKQDFNRRHGLH